MTSLSFEPQEREARERQYFAALRPFYHAVASVSEVDGTGLDEFGTTRVLGRELLGQRLVLARLGGEIVAVHGTCPHRGAGLALGWLNKRCDAIVCPYHGFEWGADGWIKRIPALEAAGKALPSGDGWRAETYPTVVRYGLVWVCLDPSPRLPLVEVAEADDPDFDRLVQPVQIWRATCGRMVEASLDTYHFAFAHRASIGDPAFPNAPNAEVSTDECGFTIEYELSQPDTRMVTYANKPAPTSGGGLVLSSYRFTAQPSVVYMVKQSGRVSFSTLVAMHPRSANETVVYRIIFPRRDWEVDLEEFQRTQAQVFDEDRSVVESQRPWEVKTDLDAELHAMVDRPTVGYRRWLASLGITAS